MIDLILILLHLFFQTLILIENDLIDVLQVLIPIFFRLIIDLDLDVDSGGQVQLGEGDVSDELSAVRVVFVFELTL